MRIAPSKTPFRYNLGDRGEIVAANYLKEKGYEILEKNYRCSIGEIDLIACKGPKIYFIEIKTRRSHRYGRPEEAVDYRKQKKLSQLAAYYLKAHKKINQPIGFIVMGITWEKNKDPQVKLIENAFELDKDRYGIF